MQTMRIVVCLIIPIRKCLSLGEPAGVFLPLFESLIKYKDGKTLVI